MAFTFLHTADIHLDSPMKGLTNYPGAPVRQLRNATRAAFEGLIQKALEQKVDFIIIAGDLYDGDWPDYTPGLFFNLMMEKLGGIPVYLIYGNHDAVNKLTKSIELPNNVHLFNHDQASSVEHPLLPVTLHGQSFATQAVTENLAKEYPPPVADRFNIGILHTCLDGNENHSSYAPCTLEELDNHGYDYWALGHIHIAAQKECTTPVVFPGCLQGRHIKETGRKGAVIVKVDDDFTTSIEPVYFDYVRWEHLRVDVEYCKNLQDVQQELSRKLAELEQQLLANTPEVGVVRISLQGQTSAHADIGNHHDDLVTYIHDIAKTSEVTLWIEKIKFNTFPRKEVQQKVDAELLRILETEVENLIGNPLEDEYINEHLESLKATLTRTRIADIALPAADQTERFTLAIRDAADRLINALQSR